jgi:hypothetical protein
MFSTVVVGIDQVLSLEQFLGLLNADLDVDPVPRRTILEIANAVR